MPVDTGNDLGGKACRDFNNGVFREAGDLTEPFGRDPDSVEDHFQQDLGRNAIVLSFGEQQFHIVVPVLRRFAALFFDPFAPVIPIPELPTLCTDHRIRFFQKSWAE